jgi:hypothetical protein
VTSITPLPMHPSHLDKSPDQTGEDYVVPIVDEFTGQLASVRVPYRSTLKKFQAKWIGQIEGSVRGKPKLLPDKDYLGGTLINGTGKQLHHVYIAFNYPAGQDLQAGDWMLYVPVWEDGASMDLRRAFNVGEDGSENSVPYVDKDRRINGRVKGRLNVHGVEWYEYCVSELRGGSMSEGRVDDSGRENPKSLVTLSFFERLPPMQNQNRQSNRLELLRRGGRMLDMSGALASGAMVVIAQANGEIPIPMEVEGDKVTGDGTIFYQFVLPLDRSELRATTQPTTDEAQ